MLNESLNMARCVFCFDPFEPEQELRILVGDIIQVTYAHKYCPNSPATENQDA
jgi:hypothetical protein